MASNKLKWPESARVQKGVDFQNIKYVLFSKKSHKTEQDLPVIFTMLQLSLNKINMSSTRAGLLQNIVVLYLLLLHAQNHSVALFPMSFCTKGTASGKYDPPSGVAVLQSK